MTGILLSAAGTDCLPTTTGTPNKASRRPGPGVSIDGYYVVIHGDFHGARARMVELFGATWCGQYAELEHVPGAEWRELIKIPADGAETRLCLLS